MSRNSRKRGYTAVVLSTEKFVDGMLFVDVWMIEGLV